MPCPDCANVPQPPSVPSDSVPSDCAPADSALPSCPRCAEHSKAVDAPPLPGAAVPPAVTASVAIRHRDTRHLGQRGRRR
ncbi:MAG: hypothetical protein GAK31_00913 [Stenotrophomonas maltophilia]|uniref:Uncharacterized protein n=1 Tax=Stenotrophomonas maltophilia TaxID=40324 RepID=A0A7V8FK80_STEMA|nr:MAG: hypothetical protein GAK31_00913 [Stenotrophomonas maltophilia]